LKIALVFTGAFCAVGVYPLTVFWPSGWAWHAHAEGQSLYLQMIIGIYATLGVFLINAARNLLEHLSLIGGGRVRSFFLKCFFCEHLGSDLSYGDSSNPIRVWLRKSSIADRPIGLKHIPDGVVLH
jgi:hypothetical protein